MILWGVFTVQADWVCGCNWDEDIWYWISKSDRTQSELYKTNSVIIKLLCTLFWYSALIQTCW